MQLRACDSGIGTEFAWEGADGVAHRRIEESFKNFNRLKFQAQAGVSK